MKVHEAMTPNKECVGPNDCIEAAEHVLDRTSVKALPVLDHSQVMGSLGKADINKAVEAVGRPEGLLNVRDAMKHEAYSVLDTDDLEAADRQMDAHQLDTITVLNHERIIVGMLQRKRS